MRATLILATAVVALSLIGMPALAAPPPEVTGVGFDAGGSLFWGPTTDTDTYNVYRRASNDAGTPPRCHLWQLGQALAPGLADPRPGEWFGYVVTAESVEGESPPVRARAASSAPCSGAAPRSPNAGCSTASATVVTAGRPLGSNSSALTATSPSSSRPRRSTNRGTPSCRRA